jgi:sigma-B regulation protein RsbU (phosphoserine phosphatase)
MRLKDTRAGITMADVAGKGLRAALLSAKLQATLRALATGQESPAVLCNQINRIFHRDSIPSIFASLLYAEISSDSGTIRYVNAGHLPPFHLTNDKVQEQDKGELALGLAPNFSFTERTIILNRDELFFAYSDGLTEACNEAGEFFGLERLKLFLTKTRHLDVNAIGDLLIEEVDRFTGQARVNDDLSVIILKRK